MFANSLFVGGMQTIDEISQHDKIIGITSHGLWNTKKSFQPLCTLLQHKFLETHERERYLK